MPVIFVAGVVALVLYVWLCTQVVVRLLVPYWAWPALLGAAAGAVLVVGMLVAGLAGAAVAAAPTVTPVHARRRLQAVRSLHGRDVAWANYLFGQARDDLASALRPTWRVVESAWGRSFTAVGERPALLIVWPLLAFPAIALVSGTAGVMAAIVVVYGCILVAFGIAWLIWGASVGALRGADHGVRRLRRARATCPHGGCNERSMLPGYRCECGVVHHDIRAGRQGVFFRRCECSRLLPTTVLKAAAGLVAVCQRCDRDLHPGAGVVTDVAIPVVGPVSAGKTRLVLAGMVALRRHITAEDGALDALGPGSARTLEHADQVVARGEATAKTAVGAPPAISVGLVAKGRRAQLHVFDAAGESFASQDTASELPFLDRVEGLVFVLDPFSIPAVIARLEGEQVCAAEPAREDPADSYDVTVQWLKAQRKDSARLPLAVAVVKADRFLGLPPAGGMTAESGPDAIRAWLVEQDLDNLVVGMERDFREVRYHLVSSWDAGIGPDGRVGPLSAAVPLLWLLSRTGVPVSGRERVGTP